jgi:hypothetical protein
MAAKLVARWSVHKLFSAEALGEARARVRRGLFDEYVGRERARDAAGKVDGAGKADGGGDGELDMGAAAALFAGNSSLQQALASAAAAAAVVHPEAAGAGAGISVGFDYGDSDDEEARVEEQRRVLAEQRERLNLPHEADNGGGQGAAAAAAAAGGATGDESDSEGGPGAASGAAGAAAAAAAAGAAAQGSGPYHAADMVHVPSTTLWLGSVSESVTSDQLTALFSQCGEVARVTLLSFKNQAFITFKTRRGAEVARERHANLTLDGRVIKVRERVFFFFFFFFFFSSFSTFVLNNHSFIVCVGCNPHFFF